MLKRRGALKGRETVSTVAVTPPNHSSALAGDEAGDGERPEFAVRGDEPVARCPYCDRPFHSERLRTLHCGLEHADRLSVRERAAFERAYLAEGAEIRRVRLYALGAVVLLYFTMLFLYAIVP